MRDWTQEERQWQSQLIHNWKPWKKSTGAKSPDGKAVCKMNAYKTGWHSIEFRNIRRLFSEQNDELINIRHLVRKIER